MGSWPLEEFLDGDGNPGADRLRTTPAKIAAAALAVTRRIPPTWFVGVGLHESSYTLNERDTEQSGKQTGGVYQLTLGGTPTDFFGDAHKALRPESDVWRLEGATAILADLADGWANEMIAASGMSEAECWAAGLGGYLAWAHNAGLYDRTRDDGTKTIGPLTSVKNNGLDWQAARARNATLPYFRDKIGPYGDDAITGGPDYVAPATGDDGGPLDDSGAAIPAPLFDAATETKLRMVLVALVALLLMFAALKAAPLKGSLHGA